MLSRFISWLKESPTEKPSDLIIFDKSIERLRKTSDKLDRYVDETDRVIAQMRNRRTRLRRKTV